MRMRIKSRDLLNFVHVRVNSRDYPALKFGGAKSQKWRIQYEFTRR